MNDAYAKGYMAFKEGMELEDNPFEEGTEDYESWEAGWVSGADEELENEESD